MKFFSREPKPIILSYMVCTLVSLLCVFLYCYLFFTLKLESYEIIIFVLFMGRAMLALYIISQPVFFVRFLSMQTNGVMKLKIVKVFFTLLTLFIISVLCRSGEAIALLFAGGISVH